MSIKLSYDICKTVQNMHVNFINKSEKLKELRNEIKSLYNLLQPFHNSRVDTHTLYQPQNSITAPIVKINNRININHKIIIGIDSKLKHEYNNKLDFLSYPNQETLNFLFYTEVFPNRIERESIPKEKINIDCINNMINIHKKSLFKSLFISSENKGKISTYKEFLKK
ncbi:TPA: hypothetical protein ACKRGR_002069 [Proteus mirabilis]|uniref:hypothetical protein n=1 Tax=Proteus mirabilis TaxID=584 RepID=UPI001A2BCEFB|nr:hypothetical protein [Proteus mirabilis]MBI6458722.1 hypothetical protein [Proteus mirabilis]HEI9754987.1 hypothetical protein [Proteus mirabilis]HEK1877138.1 hypothetical protein [Proteus mirabilis]